MEVHKHPHHVTHKKKWAEYLLEFFMLFLAVFLGFIAENIREHFVERNKEKEYMTALYQNLKTDTSGIQFTIELNETKIQKIDSLIHLLQTENNNTGLIYYLGRHVARGIETFRPDNSGYMQLMNSGGLRLIRNSVLLDSLEGYRRNLTSVEIFQSTVRSRTEEFLKISADLFDINVFNEIVMDNLRIIMPVGNPPLLEHTKKEINRSGISLHYILINLKFTKEDLKRLLKRAENLLILLKKEYHLENQ